MPKAKNSPPQGTVISDTNITLDIRPEYNEHLGTAIKALAEAITANAEAIKAVALMAENGTPKNAYGVYLGS